VRGAGYHANSIELNWIGLDCLINNLKKFDKEYLHVCMYVCYVCMYVMYVCMYVLKIIMDKKFMTELIELIMLIRGGY